MVNYYTDLPAGYREVFHIDAKSKKVGIAFTVVSLVITVASLLVIGLLTGFSAILSALDSASKVEYVVPYLVLVVCLFSYIVLHELVHGAAYKALTHQKLTFGITLTVAFCGVPDIYTSRKTALIALTAPLVVFSIVFLALMACFRTSNPVYFAIFSILFSIHLGGCVGDIYVTVLLMTKYRNPELLMRDTGPAQTLYLPE